MSLAIWYALVGVVLFAIGLYGLIIREQMLRKILALNIMGSSVFLLLVAVADRRPGRPPDPVPHAMVLTGIVVAVSATALALALARRLPARSEPDQRANEGPK
ncbi:MAG: sodium:proton antiporter [Gemmataceae bacterium]